MIKPLTLISALLCSAIGVASALLAQAEPRQVYSESAQPWLRAVGQLHVPGSRLQKGYRVHNVEDCSATLISSPGSMQANTIVTAWHCLELYTDLTRPISFTLLPNSREPIVREARLLATGGGMHADWAVMRLHRVVLNKEVEALAVHASSADPARSIAMAGYSRDGGLGDHGQTLTFDPACAITQQGRDVSDTNCAAHKGASGGPVVQREESGNLRFCGVISQGDGAGLSTFVPVARFRQTARSYL